MEISCNWERVDIGLLKSKLKNRRLSRYISVKLVSKSMPRVEIISIDNMTKRPTAQ